MSCLEVAQSLRDNITTVANGDDYYNDAQVKTRDFLETLSFIPGLNQAKCEALAARYNLIHQDPAYTKVIDELTKTLLSKQENLADRLNQAMEQYRVS
jgi:hypothetical protein